MIPKIIHQTWKTKIIPHKWKEAVRSCKEINKSFKYILWTDESMDVFVYKNYPDFYKIYKSYKYHIQRCDVFRYLVLYKYGGVYLDMDILCKKSIVNLLHYDIVLAKSPNIDYFYTNAFFMIKPKHPFLKFCIDNLEKYMDSYSYFGKHLHVMSSTGPLFLTNRFNDYKKIPNMYILNKTEFAGDCSICNENTCIGGEYFLHIPGNSWHEIDSVIYNWTLCHYKKIIGIVLITSGIAIMA
jgi:mannosyltransferase OCH1-like enzyme